VRIMPDALALPGPAQMRLLNAELEQRVETRTTELRESNAALSREVDERRHAEAEVGRLNALLSRRVAELEALFDVLPIGVGIAADAECRKIRANATLARMLRLDPDRNMSLSAPPGEAPTHYRVLHDDAVVPTTDLPMQKCTRTNRAVLDFSETIEFGEGDSIEVLCNAVPLRDPAGKVTGCVATFQDTTALAKAHATAERYATIMASSEEAIVATDVQGRITDWN